MSTPFKFVAEFATDPDSFWKIFWNDDYNAILYDRLEVKERRFLQRDEDDEKIRFQLRVMPRRDLPAFVQKFVGGDLGYTEISTWWKRKNRIDVKVEPTLMKDKTQIDAVYTIEPLGAKRVRRTFEGKIAIAIPLVGGKVEKFIIGDMEKAYQVAADTTDEWLRKHP